MKNFIKLNTLLRRIPKSLFEESPEADFLDWMIDGLKLLPSVIYYEPKIEMFEIVDGKVQLPKYVKSINDVKWMSTNPSKECIKDLEECIVQEQTLNPKICRPYLTYQMWLDSPYFKENFKTLKFIGTDKSLVKNSCGCWTTTCSETFIITPMKTMHLSLDSGWICINYDTPVCDENDDLLIPDHAILHEFLVAHAIYKHWENRQFTKEEQAGNFYQDYRQKQALLLRQAKGDYLLRNTNIYTVSEIVGGNYRKLISLPEILFYAR